MLLLLRRRLRAAFLLAGAVDDFAGGQHALVELGVGAGVFAQAAVEAVFEQGGQVGELGFDGQAGGFAFADVLARLVFAAAKGVDGVLQLLQTLLGDAVLGEGRGVGGCAGVDGLGGVGEGGGAQGQQGAVAHVGGGLQGAVLLLAGVGVQVAGYFAGRGGEGAAAVGFGGGNALALAAQALGAQGLQGGDELQQLVDHVLHGLVVLVGLGVKLQGGEGVFGGGEPVVLFAGQHGIKEKEKRNRG